MSIQELFKYVNKSIESLLKSQNEYDLEYDKKTKNIFELSNNKVTFAEFTSCAFSAVTVPDAIYLILIISVTSGVSAKVIVLPDTVYAMPGVCNVPFMLTIIPAADVV